MVSETDQPIQKAFRHIYSDNLNTVAEAFYTHERILPIDEGGIYFMGKKNNEVGNSAVRNYKDTVFRMLFNDKAELLALYNAMNHTDYTDSEVLQIATLESAIYMCMKNDVSFVMDTTLNLYEQQSTFNPNMPLRHLLYVAKQFEELLIGKDLYSRKPIILPEPRFVTFYNGSEKQPEQTTLCLSNSYAAHTESPNLELRVLQININPGYNEEIKENCPTLCQYILFVDRIRTYAKEMPLQEAVEQAVEECIKEGILSEFLLREKAKVVSMSIFEFDQELHDKTIREEEYLRGKDDGYNQGKDDGYNRGKTDGYSQGKTDGYNQGYEKLSALINCLIADGLSDDISKVTTDQAYRDEMLKKYNI